MRLTISEIASALNAAQPIEARDVVTGITWDSRAVAAGDLYVALPGERVDGHDYARAAVAAGACAVLAMRDVEVKAPVIRVADTAAALTELARFWRTRLAGTVIGLTGSTGKTTTKNLVRDVLGHAGSVVATVANQNNELGVPRTLLSADSDTRCVVVEMGMRGAGQIAELCSFVRPDWGLVTNVGESHIELLGSREAIAHAKAELLEALGEGGIAFVNAADDFASELCAHARLAERGVHAVFFDGSGRLAQAGGLAAPFAGAPAVFATDVRLDAQGRAAFTLNAERFGSIGLAHADGSCPCALELRGLHNVSNACSAAAVGLASGMTLAQCCEALAGAQPERGRQQVSVSPGGVTVVDDSYNANPDSMRASLATFSALDVDGRRIAVLGDMLELGDFSRECHERVGALAAQAGLDLLVCVGGLSRDTARQACRCGMPANSVITCADACEALAVVEDVVQSGDAVLVKASHSVGLSRVAEGLVG